MVVSGFSFKAKPPTGSLIFLGLWRLFDGGKGWGIQPKNNLEDRSYASTKSQL